MSSEGNLSSVFIHPIIFLNLYFVSSVNFWGTPKQTEDFFSCMTLIFLSGVGPPLFSINIKE